MGKETFHSHTRTRRYTSFRSSLLAVCNMISQTASACIHDAKLCNGVVVLCRCLSRVAFASRCNLASKSRHRREIEARFVAALSRLGRRVSPRSVERRSATTGRHGDLTGTATSPAGRTRWAVASPSFIPSHRYNDGLASTDSGQRSIPLHNIQSVVRQYFHALWRPKTKWC